MSIFIAMILGFGAVILLLDVWAIRVLYKNRENPVMVKTFWFVIVIILPILGPMLYFFIGRKGNVARPSSP